MSMICVYHCIYARSSSSPDDVEVAIAEAKDYNYLRVATLLYKQGKSSPMDDDFATSTIVQYCTSNTVGTLVNNNTAAVGSYHTWCCGAVASTESLEQCSEW